MKEQKSLMMNLQQSHWAVSYPYASDLFLVKEVTLHNHTLTEQISTAL